MADEAAPGETPLQGGGSGQTLGAPSPPPPPSQTGIAPAGRREAFRDVRRQLTNEDLANPGVQKLVLEDLERAEAQCEILQGYVERFHDANTRAAIAEEKLKGSTALEIMFGVGVGLGGAIIALAPLFWNEQPKGYLALIIGFLMVIGATFGRVRKG